MSRCKQCKIKIEKGNEIYDNLSTFCCKSCRISYTRAKVRVVKEKVKVKKEKIKKKKSESVSVLKKKLDTIFSRYIRVRDAIKTTGTTTHLKCYTCDEVLEVTRAHNMHFIPRGHLKYRFSDDNCHGGCMICNVMKHGNYIEYFVRMESEYGRKKVDEMISNKNELCKLTSGDYIDLILKYTTELATLENNK